MERLAVFDSPQTVAEAVKAEFGIEVSRQAVEAYDPGKVNGRRLSDKLRERFNRHRKAFTENVSEIPMASKAVRLRTLTRLAQ